jgi:hypothetical protein
MLDDNKDCKVIFLDAGVYIITDTLVVPAGTRMVGEGWSSLMGSGAAFGDMKKPKVVVQVGKAGDKGTAEFTDIMCVFRHSASGLMARAKTTPTASPRAHRLPAPSSSSGTSRATRPARRACGTLTSVSAAPRARTRT